MDTLRDTPLEVGTIVWALEPPRTSMIVVVKGTFDLRDAPVSRLSLTQDVPTGELYWDDDPERSLRYPNDYALLKPRGECLVTGSVRTLTGRPEERTTAAFRVGSVARTIVVHGDRTWASERPAPFEAMPLAWERAYGGPGVAENPLGVGAEGDRVPNLEVEGRLVTAAGQRPPTAGVGPIGMTWPARRALTGTYDAAWRRERWPWLPRDFRYAFFNEAPEAQRIDGYWAGGEEIELQHLHPTLPRLRTRLSRVSPRAFVTRDEAPGSREAFEEVGLVCDTITIDADRGLALVVWRGRVDLAHASLARDGIARLFLTHDDLEAADARPATLDACHARMVAAAEARQAQLDGMQPEAPPPIPDDATLSEDAPDAAVAAAHAELRFENATADAEAAAGGGDPLEDLKAQLASQGIDVDALTKEHEAEQAAMPSLEPAKLEEAFRALGAEPPKELDEIVAAAIAAQAEPTPEAPPAPPEEVDKRAQLVALHAAGKPIVGDYSGLELAGLDLRGLDARDAILSRTNLRGANLSQARLDGANLQEADLLGATLSRASLRGADLEGALLEDARLDGARMARASLRKVEASHAIFDEAELKHAVLEDADLREASFVGADAEDARFHRSKMEGCRFLRARLVSARLYEVVAPKMLFEGADLTKLRTGRGADLTGLSARRVVAADSTWRGAILRGAAFDGATLARADFTDADLTSASLAGCPMREVILQGAVLVDAKLERADAMAASFQEANLAGADLRFASLYTANFFGAHGHGARLEGADVAGTLWERNR